jgi:ribosomal protein S6E (S10)
LQIKDTDDKSFQKFMDVSTMSRENQAMVKLLFSEKNLKSKMDVGFKGNPNIGSVVLNQIVNSDDFDTFANGFSAGDKIFIISSIFGGTGASGFPLLLKTLRTGNSFPNFQTINDAEIGAVTILPYFKLKPSDESEIDSSTFISKTKSALAYYEDNISKNNQINALYYLGDDVQNVYSNVAKYAMENTRVYLDVVKNQHTVVIQMKNISKQELNISADELMQRFVRGETSRNTEGSGLGLSIASSLTELQGGKFHIYLDGDLFKVTIGFEMLVN